MVLPCYCTVAVSFVNLFAFAMQSLGIKTFGSRNLNWYVDRCQQDLLCDEIEIVAVWLVYCIVIF